MNSLGKLSVTAKCDADTLAEILDGIDEVREYTEELAEVGYSRFTLNFEPENDPSESIFFAFADKKIAIVDMIHKVGVHQGEGRFNAHDAKGALFKAPALLLCRVGGVVGGDHVNGAVKHPID